MAHNGRLLLSDMVLLQESTRIERIILIHKEFIEQRELTARDMADRFGVTRRTIQYDLSAMAHVLPIYYDNGRWFYEETAVSISPY